jgi:DNA polymerase-1
VIKKRKTRPAVAFDNGGSDLRNDIFPEYKAHRDATPEAKIAVPYIQELLRAMHIPSEVKGYEADDLIGPLQKRRKKIIKYLWLP